jgi:hypothetical protein
MGPKADLDGKSRPQRDSIPAAASLGYPEYGHTCEDKKNLAPPPPNRKPIPDPPIVPTPSLVTNSPELSGSLFIPQTTDNLVSKSFHYVMTSQDTITIHIALYTFCNTENGNSLG